MAITNCSVNLNGRNAKNCGRCGGTVAMTTAETIGDPALCFLVVKHYITIDGATILFVSTRFSDFSVVVPLRFPLFAPPPGFLLVSFIASCILFLPSEILVRQSMWSSTIPAYLLFARSNCDKSELASFVTDAITLIGFHHGCILLRSNGEDSIGIKLTSDSNM
jgi:hypothetical protein